MFCVIEKALQRDRIVLSEDRLVLLQLEEFLTSAYCEHDSVILTTHSHMNDLDEYTQHIWNVTSSSHKE